jgi:hypothetical protein
MDMRRSNTEILEAADRARREHDHAKNVRILARDAGLAEHSDDAGQAADFFDGLEAGLRYAAGVVGINVAFPPDILAGVAAALTASLPKNNPQTAAERDEAEAETLQWILDSSPLDDSEGWGQPNGLLGPVEAEQDGR